MTDIAKLAFAVESRPLEEAEKKLDDLTGATKRTEKATEKFERQWVQTTARLAKVGAISASVAALAAGVFVVNKLRGAYSDAIDTIERADRLGWGADELSRLEFGARSAGVRVEELSTGMKGLTRFMVEGAKGTKEQAGLLEQLGIEAKEADGSLRSSRAVLRDIADVMPRIKDPTDRAALAVKLFGENGAALLPLFEDGAKGMDRWAQKSDELGYTLTNEAGAGAREVKRQMDELKLSMDALWRQSLTPLLPKLGDLASILNSPQFRSGFQAIAEGAIGATNALAGLIGKIGQVSQAMKTQDQQTVQFLQDQVNGFQREIDAINSDQTGVWSIRARLGFDNQKVIDDLEAQKAPIQAEIDRRLRFTMPAVEAVIAGSNKPVAIDWGALGGVGGGKGRKATERADRDAERALREAQRLAEAQADWRDRLLDLQADLAGPVAQVHRDYQRQLSDLERSFQSGEVALRDYVAMNDALVASRERELQELDARMNPGRDLLHDLQFELELMRMTNAERATAIQLRGMEADQVQKYGSAIAQLNREIEDQMQRTELVDGFRDSFRDAVADVLKGTDSIGNAFEKMIDRINAMVLDRIAGNFTDFLFGQQGQAGGGQWGDLLSMAAGLFGGGREYGGDVRGDRMYRVGERNRPELLNLGRGQQYLIPGDAGKVEPIRGENGGRKVTVNQTIRVEGRVDRRTAAQIAQQSGVKIRTATARFGG